MRSVKASTLVVLICSVFGFSLSYAQGADVEPLQRAIVVSLITDDEPANTQLGARSIRALYPTDQQLTDMVAESLLNLTTSEPTGEAFDAVRWHLQSIGDLQNPRYRETVLAIRERTKNEDLLAEVEEALPKMQSEASTSYVFGSTDLLRSRAEAQQVLKSNKRSNRSAFASLRTRPSLTQVLQALGAPDDIFVWNTRAEKLALSYEGAGLFLFGTEQSTPPRFVATQAYRELVDVRRTYKGENFGRAQILASVIGKPLVQYYKADHRRIASDMDEMHILVRRIVETPIDTLHRYDDAMYRIALQALGRSPDPRAIELIKLVEAMPGDNDYKDMAIKLVKADRERKEERASAEVKP